MINNQKFPAVGQFLREIISEGREQIICVKSDEVAVTTNIEVESDIYMVNHVLCAKGDYFDAWKHFLRLVSEVQSDGDIIFWRVLPEISEERRIEYGDIKYQIYAKFSIGIKK